MIQSKGASVPDQALVASDQAASRLAPTGPSRKKLALTLARALGNDLRNRIAHIVSDADMGTKRAELLGRHYLAADRIFEAIAMEACQGRDAEERPDPKDDSAAPEGIAHNQSGQSNGE